MKTYYCVATSIFNDGRVVCNLVSETKSQEKPAQKFTSDNRADRYIDYFESKDEALEFVNQSKKA